MNKIFFALMLLLCAPIAANACDICGCGVGNNYIGILPEFHRHIFGLRYRYNSLYTHIGAGGNFTYLTTKETYQTTEAWGGWNLGKKFRLMATVPYSFNERSNQGKVLQKNGLGDVAVAGYYQLVNTRHVVLKNKLLVQSLWVGSGVKLATGAYNPADKTDANNNANLFQLGTGSYDFNLSAMYDVRIQDAGLNINGNYKITTANKYNYVYGNKLGVSAQAYYKWRILKTVTLAPNAGLQFESGAQDTDKNLKVFASGGKVLLGTGGAEVSFSKFAVGASYQKIMHQQLAHGIVQANNRCMLHLAVAL